MASLDVVAALGYTPENIANKSTDSVIATPSNVLYPTQGAIKAYIDAEHVILVNNSFALSNMIYLGAF